MKALAPPIGVLAAAAEQGVDAISGAFDDARHCRYADTFERRDGRRQVVYVQATAIPSRP